MIAEAIAADGSAGQEPEGFQPMLPWKPLTLELPCELMPLP